MDWIYFHRVPLEEKKERERNQHQKVHLICTLLLFHLHYYLISPIIAVNTRIQDWFTVSLCRWVSLFLSRLLLPPFLYLSIPPSLVLLFLPSSLPRFHAATCFYYSATFVSFAVRFFCWRSGTRLGLSNLSLSLSFVDLQRRQRLGSGRGWPF